MFSLPLFLCPTHFVVDDILATVLALYMHDKKQPLPSHAEVLLCTPYTTTEEVKCTFRYDFPNIYSYFHTVNSKMSRGVSSLKTPHLDYHIQQIEESGEIFRL